MRLSTIQYLEKEQVTVSIYNNNAALAILDGQPVYFDNYNVTSVVNTDHPEFAMGVYVKNYTEALGQSPNALFCGIAKTQSSSGIPVGGVGEAVVYGFTDVVITRRNRAASTDSWSSVVSIGAGDQLIGVSNGNNVSWQGVVPNLVVLAVSSQGQTQTITLPIPVYIAAGESQNSIAGKATTGAQSVNSLLYDANYRMKAFVRAM